MGGASYINLLLYGDRIRILINCLPAISGGAVSYLRNIVPLLCEMFDDSHCIHQLVILAHEDQAELFHITPATEVLWIKGRRAAGWRRLVWENRNIARVASEVHADVIFTPYQVAPRIRGFKLVLMIRNMEPFHFKSYPYDKKSWLRNTILCWQSSRSLCSADRVIAVSGFAEEILTGKLNVSLNTIRRIYHGRDASFSPKGGNDEDREYLEAIGVRSDYLLTCGSLLPYRRCEDVIDAFNRVVEGGAPGLQLVIAGSGSDKRYGDTIEKKVANSPYKDKILAIGHVSKETMVALYRHCHVCVTATEIEACPNIAIEAMSSGCAVVFADNPPLPEMFADTCVAYSPRDIEDLSNKIQRLLDNNAMRLDLGRGARERAAKFSWYQCAQETYSALVDWPEG